MYAKRFWIALIFGVITGLICAFISMSGAAAEQKTMVFLSALLNRALIGFVIGISAWKLGWALHGIIVGLIVTLAMSFPLIWVPEAGFNVFLMYTIGGIVWGFIIELFTTIIFKAPIRNGIAAD